MEAVNFVEALVTNYPDLCNRIVSLKGEGTIPQHLAADKSEAERVEQTMVAVCQDFQKRASQLSTAELTDAEIFEQMALALTTALSNVFGLGVWLGERGLARFPKPPAPPESRYSEAGE